MASAHPRRTPLRCLASGMAILAVLCGCAPQSAPPSTTTNASVTAPLSSDDGVDGVATEQTPVYWAGSGTQSGYLFREFRAPTADHATDPVTEAVMIMTSADPLDPDYTSRWAPARSVGTSVSRDGTITVDMPAEAFAARLNPAEAHLALQQLVYTATASAVTAGLLDSGTATRVKILVDGRSGYEAFGSVTLNDPLTRDESMAAPLWLIDPQSGVTTSQDVTIYGRYLEDVTDPAWQVLSGDDVVQEGTLDPQKATASRGSTQEFRHKVTLEPGSYTVRVTATNRDGDPVSDDHEFSVAEE